MILILLALVLCVVGIAFFAPQILSFFQWVRQTLNPAQAVTPVL